MDAPSDGWWTARLATFVAIVTACTASAFVISELSADTLETGLERALGDNLLAQAGMLAAAVAREPLEAVALAGTGPDADALNRSLDVLGASAGQDVVVFGTDGVPLGRAPTLAWAPSAFDRDLILRARDRATLGNTFRLDDDTLHKAAYSPVPGHPGFVAGVEVGADSLRAADDLETLQLLAGVAIVVVGGGLAAVLTAALSRPLTRLEAEVLALRPGSSPAAIHVQGPREVRRLARSVQALLGAIGERDVALQRSHDARIAEITTLAATVAHEVRNPVNALGIILGGIGSAHSPERVDQLVRRGEGCVAEIEGIVERFLDLSRPLAPRVVASDLAAIARACALEAEPALQVSVRGDGRAETDPELLGQVLRNLLRNATQAGATHASIVAGPGSLTVQDDGPGIPPDAAAQVFEWFHTTRAQGTGLGLPLSRRICHALGGELTLVSGQPATFRITLPVGAP